MRLYKRLVRWWTDEYGGEWKAHADFTMEQGDSFWSAFQTLFATNPDPFWWTMVKLGKVRKVHPMFSFTPEHDADDHSVPAIECDPPAPIAHSHDSTDAASEPE